MIKELKTKRLNLKNAGSFASERFAFDITDKKGEKIGELSLLNSKEDGCIIVNTVIFEPYRRNGFALEIGDAVIEELINRFPKLEIAAVVDKNNNAGNALCQRLDFEPEYYDDEINSNIYYM